MNWRQRALLGLLLLAHWMLMWQSVVLTSEFGPYMTFLLAVMSGVLLGQCILASLWLVCLRDSRWSRGLCVLLMAAWAGLAVLLGIPGRESLAVIDVLWVGLPVLLYLLACSAVLYVAWRFFRWEIRLPGDDGSSRKQFSLRRSLAMIAMVCVILAVARNSLRLEDQGDVVELEMLPMLLLTLLLGAAVGSVVLAVNCCTMLPMIAVMFRSQEHWLWWTTVLVFLGIPAYSILVAIIESLVVWLIGVHDPDTLGMLMVTNMVQGLTVVVTLACLYSIGFQFKRFGAANHVGALADCPESSDLLTPPAPPSDYYPHGGL